MIALNDLKRLAEVKGPCLSVFQPLRDDCRQAAVTKAGLLAAEHLAESLLSEKGMDEAARERFLRPLAKIAKKAHWPGRTGGIVIFRAPGFTRASFWLGPMEAQVKLDDEFFVLPLLPGFQARSSFWLLALSTKRTRLFRGTSQRLIEVELPGDLARGMIDRALCPIIAKSHDPLILVGVPRELAAYREVNSYAGIVQEGIHGSPDGMGEADLHRTALELVQTHLAERTRQVLRYTEAVAGQGLLTVDFEEIEKAARTGGVEQLYVTEKARERQESVNRIVLEVIRHSGKVDYIDSQELGLRMAAALRYRLTPAPALAAQMANS